MGVAATFGKNLCAARRRAGLSQEKVAFRADLHRTEIGLLERGERLPRIDTLLKLAGALGVKVESPLLADLEWTPGDMRRGSFSRQLASEQGEASTHS